MRKSIKKNFTLVMVLLVFPLLTYAQPLVVCKENCGFSELMTLINTIIQFLLFKMAVPIAAIMFAYAGFLMVTSGGSSETKGKAKKIFTNVALGLIIAVAAWLIIHTILSVLGYDGKWIGF